jgi:hypothetical protein
LLFVCLQHVSIFRFLWVGLLNRKDVSALQQYVTEAVPYSLGWSLEKTFIFKIETEEKHKSILSLDHSNRMSLAVKEQPRPAGDWQKVELERITTKYASCECVVLLFVETREFFKIQF